jgi:hypothetical protein
MTINIQATQGDLSSLSQAAQLVLDYIVRHRKQGGGAPCLEDLARSLRGRYPLFRYLFPNLNVCDGAIAELHSDGWLDGTMPEDEKWNRRLRRIVVECIRFKANEIIDRIPLRDIAEVAESAAHDDNVEPLDEDLKFLNSTPLDFAAPLSRQYSRALLELGSNIEKQKLLRLVTEKAGMEPVDLPASSSRSSLPMGWFESKDFAPNRLFRAAVALVDCQGDCDENLRAATELAENPGTVIFLLIGETEPAATRFGEFCKSKYAVLIREEDLKRAVLSRDYTQAMRNAVFPQVRPSTLSPFQYTGPVTGEGFVGRKAEMERVLNSARGNFAVLGARTIGKSSLLLTMRERLTTGPERGRAIPVFVDATQNRLLRHFQKNLMQAILKETEQRNVQVDWVDPGEEFFEDLSAVLRKSRQRYLFLIDEIDNVLQDAKITLLEEFIRSMSNIGCARFVIAGYRNLREHIEDRNSSFFNLFESIVLNPLARLEAAELVSKQMARICVGFENDQVVELILDFASTFASYLQRMCHLLLSRLDEPGHNRTISLDDVTAVYGGEQFTTALTSAVTMGGERPLEVLERLILYWAVSCPNGQFSEQELLTGLGRYMFAPKLTEVRKALQYLTLTYLLADSGSRYHYYLPHLREKLRLEPNLEDVIQGLAREYRQIDPS